MLPSGAPPEPLLLVAPPLPPEPLAPLPAFVATELDPRAPVVVASAASSSEHASGTRSNQSATQRRIRNEDSAPWRGRSTAVDREQQALGRCMVRAWSASFCSHR